MKLTHKNYHTPANKYLSTSMIKIFMKSKPRFKAQYIDRTFVREPSPSMQLGSMVDMIATESLHKFKLNYTPKTLKKDNADLFDKQKNGRRELVTQTQYDKAIAMAEALTSTTAYQEIKDHAKQVVLTHNQEMSHGFAGIGGMLDLLKVGVVYNNEKEAIITDIKTSASFGGQEKYYWKALDYNYFLQMAMYQYLVHINYDIPIQDIECRHIVVVNDPDNLHPVYTYTFAPEMLSASLDVILDQIDQINKETEFKKQDTTWDDAIMLGRVDEDNY